MNIFCVISRFYHDRILPRVKKARGATRLNQILENLALRELSSGRNNGDFYEITINGVNINLDSRKAARKGIYEHEVLSSFLESIDEDSQVADLGSFHGIYSLLAAEKTDKDVYAVEIDDENLQHLEANIELNEAKNIKIIKRAIWNELTTISVDVGKGERSKAGLGGEKIQTITLDKLSGEKTLDVIKMDIEGAEYRALQATEGAVSPKTTLFIEVHRGEILNGFSHKFEDVVSILSQNFSTEEVLKNKDSVVLQCTSKE